MPQCYNNWTNQYVYCSSNIGVYIAVGIVIPVCILILVLLIAIWRRYKLKRIRREQQQIAMATIVPINNTEDQQQMPYNYVYPPTYTTVFETLYDKPPSYEQTVHDLSETNNTSEYTAAILPITTVTSSSQPVQPLRNQT